MTQTLTPREAAINLGIEVVEYCRCETILYALRINSEVIKQVNAGWLNYRKDVNGWTYESPKFNKETTYRNCTDGEFNLGTNLLRITMHDGNSYDGSREEARCWWDFKIPEECGFYKEFMEENVIVELMLRAHEIEEKHEKKKYERKIAAIYAGFLKK